MLFVATMIQIFSINSNCSFRDCMGSILLSSESFFLISGFLSNKISSCLWIFSFLFLIVGNDSYTKCSNDLCHCFVWNGKDFLELKHRVSIVDFDVSSWNLNCPLKLLELKTWFLLWFEVTWFFRDKFIFCKLVDMINFYFFFACFQICKYM